MLLALSIDKLTEVGVDGDQNAAVGMGALEQLRMKRTRPDRFLPVFAALCAVGPVAIWILTVGSSH